MLLQSQARVICQPRLSHDSALNGSRDVLDMHEVAWDKAVE